MADKIIGFIYDSMFYFFAAVFVFCVITAMITKKKKN